MTAIRVTGDKELQDLVASLASEGKIGLKVLRKGLRAGAKIGAAQLKSDAPKLTGAAAQSVKVKAMKRKRGRTGVLISMTATTDKGFPYPIAVESGSKSHPKGTMGKGRAERRKSSAVGWRIQPRKFGEKAIKKSANASLDKMGSTMESELEKQATKR